MPGPERLFMQDWIYAYATYADYLSLLLKLDILIVCNLRMTHGCIL